MSDQGLAIPDLPDHFPRFLAKLPQREAAWAQALRFMGEHEGAPMPVEDWTAHPVAAFGRIELRGRVAGREWGIGYEWTPIQAVSLGGQLDPATLKWIDA